MHAINSVKPTATMRAQIRYPLSEVRDRFDRMNEFCHTITTKSQLRELLFRIRFATDSPLEEGGFELSVPPEQKAFRER
jgi:hypothetical protein